MTKSVGSSKGLTIADQRNRFLDSIPGRIIDENAFTIDEICAVKNIDRCQAAELAKDNLKMGTWEMVFKKGKTRLQRAYRNLSK